MLVLTRKVTEKIYIGRDICVTVVRIEGGQIRIGIEAPREVSVVRAELLGTPRPTAAAAEAPAPGAPAPPPHAPLRTPPGGPRGSGIRRRGPSR